MNQKKQPVTLFVYPSCFHYPPGMERVEIKTSQLLLASYLAKWYPVSYADFEISIGRPNTKIQIRRYKRKVTEYLEKQEFDILALSCWTSLSYQATLTVARICRELYPEKIIVVGGYHPSARPEEFITDDNTVDYVICGEGEKALREIIEQVKTAGKPTTTQIIRSQSLTAEEIIECNWNLVEQFVRQHFPDGLGNLYMYLSRGCPFSCSFCMEPLKDQHWRAFSPQQAIRHIKQVLNQFHPGAIALSDACFGMRPGWRKEFFRLLEEISPDCWLVFETRPEYLDKEDIKLLADLNVEVQFGIESCSDDMLRIMNKTRQPQKFLSRFLEVSRWLSEYGILHRANLIFNHPGETPKTLQETFTFMDNALQEQDSSLIWVSHGYMHFPGCEVDTNRQFYEQKYGSRFLAPEWWKGEDDQYHSSLKVIPSRELDGDKVTVWERMFAERQEAMKHALSPKARTFAARKYYPNWQHDSHHPQI